MNHILKNTFAAAAFTLSCFATMAQGPSHIDLSARLLQQNISESPGRNICLSPLSLEMAMGMISNGAGGNTRQEIFQALGWQGMTQDEVNRRQQERMKALRSNEEITVELANSIWINKKAGKPKRAFVKANKNYFNAEVARLTFNADAAVKINKWCADHTRNRIPSIIDQLNPAAQIYLINALYFNGTWINHFDSNMTRPAAFHLPGGGETTVSMMHQQSHYDYAETEDCQIIDMPFLSVGKQEYSMYVLLPGEGTSADALLETLNGEKWAELTSALASEEVRLALPKFKIEYGTLLNRTLQDLGIRDAFAAGLADFSGISKTPLCIDQVIQKTVFEVTEKGAEAAAVTAISMMRSSIVQPDDIKKMTVDRPFLFTLYEKSSNTILFIGKIENPAY